MMTVSSFATWPKLGDCKGGCTKTAIRGGVSVCLRLSTFARICLRLLAFSPLRLLAFVSVCLRLFAFARICLRPPLLRPPLRDTDKGPQSEMQVLVESVQQDREGTGSTSTTSWL